MNETKPPFWTTIPGFLTGSAALLTAVGGILLTLSQLGIIGPLSTRSQRGTIIVESTPPGAVVYLNDREQGATGSNPVTIEDLKPAHYDLRLSKAGYLDWRRQLEVVGGAQHQVFAVMSQLPSTSPGAPGAANTPSAPPRKAIDLRDLHVDALGENEIGVKVAYSYDGSFDPAAVRIVATPLQRDGQPLPGLVGQHATASKGEGTAVLKLAVDDLGSTVDTSSIRVCMVDMSRKHSPYCEDFRDQRNWVASRAPAVTENAILGFSAQDISPSELQVTVSYSYTGDHGAGERHVYMSAVALQRDGEQVPRTHFEGLGGPGLVRIGAGTTTMLINKHAPGSSTSVSVRACIIGREPFGEIVCRTFPHTKRWS